MTGPSSFLIVLMLQVPIWVPALMLLLFFVILNLFHRYSIRWEKDKKIEVLKSMLDAQEEERTRIARELHDDYGVRLTTLKMYLQAAGKDNGTSPEKRHQHSLEVLDSAIRELRNILFNLSPRALKENGLQVALQELTTQVARIRHVDFELNTAAFKSPVRREAEHSLYRIAQELINNSIKYASPHTIHLSLSHFEESVHFLYEDDGKGFDPSKASKGYGLKNIEAHVDSMGGQWHLESTPGRGMSVNIEIPYHQIQAL